MLTDSLDTDERYDSSSATLYFLNEPFETEIGAYQHDAY